MEEYANTLIIKSHTFYERFGRDIHRKDGVDAERFYIRYNK